MHFIKVAIADPNTLLREGLKRIFSGETDLLVVGEADDECQTTQLVERLRPDVLLLDLKIPEREAVPLLLELARGSLPTRTLILSLFPDADRILDTAKAGAVGYALKRTHPASLIDAIRRVQRGEIWVDRQLGCADAFAEIARQRSSSAADGQASEIADVLSRRQFELLDLVAKGLTNDEISKRLFISVRTVKAHLNHIFDKLSVNNRTQAALLLMQAYHRELTETRHWKDGTRGIVEGGPAPRQNSRRRRRRTLSEPRLSLRS